MTMSYADAMAAVTAPGERFETTEIEIRGATVTVFRNAPPSLREIVATTRARGDDVFLVYENERWTFADFADQVDGLAVALVDAVGVELDSVSRGGLGLGVTFSEMGDEEDDEGDQADDEGEEKGVRQVEVKRAVLFQVAEHAGEDRQGDIGKAETQ